MNTQAHILLNHLVLSKKQDKWPIRVIFAGAVFPDFVIFIFFGWEKFVNGESEQRIWNELYYSEYWQNLIDIFNSFPLTLILLGLGFVLKNQVMKVFSYSVLLHLIFDLPLHHEDAHRHFYPFSDYKFISPVSYWDPKYYGHIFAPFEMLCYGVGCYLEWSRVKVLGKILLVSGAIAYLVTYAYFVF